MHVPLWRWRRARLLRTHVLGLARGTSLASGACAELLGAGHGCPTDLWFELCKRFGRTARSWRTCASLASVKGYDSFGCLGGCLQDWRLRAPLAVVDTAYGVVRGFDKPGLASGANEMGVSQCAVLARAESSRRSTTAILSTVTGNAKHYPTTFVTTAR